MSKGMKTTVTLLSAATMLGGAVALSQQTTTTIQRPPVNPPATGVKVVSTPDYYTNNQQTVTSIQQARVQESSPLPKGAAGLQHSARIEIRPPTGFVEPDPWVQQDHPWDIETNLPSIDSPPNP